MRVLKTLAFAGAVAVASMANAAPTIITNWTYNVTSAFDGITVYSQAGATAMNTCGPLQASPNGAIPGLFNTYCNTPSQLRWGLPDTLNGQSNLTITRNPAVGPIATCIIGNPGCNPAAPTIAQVGLTQIFTHNNWPVYEPEWLRRATVRTTLDLDAVAPIPSVNPAQFPPLFFDIQFAETPNAGPCAVGAVPCPDIFVVVGGINNFAFAYDPDGNGAQNYFVQIFAIDPANPAGPSPLTPLSPAACAAAGAAAGCVGFITNENTFNDVQFAFLITTAPLVVPEPGTLALFALALVGLGYTVRRRQA